MDSQNKGVEHLENKASLESGKTPEKGKPLGSKEIKRKAVEAVRIEGAETSEAAEGAEGFEGKISEVAGEQKAYAPQGIGQKSYTADEIEAIRAKLLAALPPQEVMIRQIRKKLRRDEKVLTKRLKKLRKKSHTHAFYLAIVVAQLRKIQEFFEMLAHATYEMVKRLWLKIVHGV